MDIYESNINSIQEQIRRKQSDKPHHATIGDVAGFITDVDHFPYTRNFRGLYSSNMPIIYGRDAGWRPRRDECYRPEQQTYPKIKPNHCFSGACNGVKPCRPDELNPISDKDAVDLTLQNRNIIDYR
jgi:hypothetical protein